MTRLFAATKSPAQTVDEQEWYLDASDVKLTRVFGIVLILHVVAIGGILMFKMIEKASSGPSEIAEVRQDPPAVRVETPAPAAAAPVPASTVGTTDGGDGGDGGLMVNHPSSTELVEYRVAAGDSLDSIAAKANVSVQKLKELNQLSGEEVFYAGQWLKVPRKVRENPAIAPVHQEPAAVARTSEAEVAPVPEVPGAKPTPASPATPPAVGPSQETLTASNSAAALASYVVQPGDTAFAIARRFGIKHTELLSANNIVQADLLQVGQKLKIPKQGN
ncbi:MAG: LysM peptidoglycan-binding domain-containing protein [Verrucomicrobiales bacterium]